MRSTNGRPNLDGHPHKTGDDYLHTHRMSGFKVIKVESRYHEIRINNYENNHSYHYSEQQKNYDYSRCTRHPSIWLIRLPICLVIRLH